MNTFELTRAHSVDEALRLVAGAASMAASKRSAAMPEIRFLAGGTTLLDLMKLDVEQPARVLDISRLPLAQIMPLDGGGLKIGAMVRNADLANDARIRRDYPVLSEALLAGASAQLRNMATTGGNLLQRTRCVYFRDTAAACNKRQPGSGCAARQGFNRNLAILGTSDSCIASNPSDMNVALMALEAVIHVSGPAGERAIPIGDFYLLPGDTPERETVLAAGELITHVSLPAPLTGADSFYLKLRDRASYEFALSSAAVVARVKQGRLTHVRVALGGVGARPWRSHEAEAVLLNQPATPALFAAAAKAAVREARPASENAFKVELIQRCLMQALTTVVSRTDRSA